MLFISIVFLCLLFLLMSNLIKLLKIPALIRKRSERYTTKLQKELDVAMEELNTIKEKEISYSYTYNIKLVRAENTVQELKNKLRKEQNIAYLKGASAEVIATYSAKGLISLILFIISIRNRYTPVVVFDERLSFQPLAGIFSFPTGVANAISVPMWVLACNVSFNYIKNLI